MGATVGRYRLTAVATDIRWTWAKSGGTTIPTMTDAKVRISGGVSAPTGTAINTARTRDRHDFHRRAGGLGSSAGRRNRGAPEITDFEIPVDRSNQSP